MVCEKCGKELDSKTSVCPQCGASIQSVKTEKKKKSVFKKWWFWVIIGVVLTGVIGSCFTEDTADTDSDTSGAVAQGGGGTDSENEIVYEVIDLRTMLDDLEANALKAERTYQDKYVEVVGRITNFDSDGKYISIEPEYADAWNFDTVRCDIKGNEQLNYLLEKEKGDLVTIRGKITSVGEIIGYVIKIAEVE